MQSVSSRIWTRVANNNNDDDNNNIIQIMRVYLPPPHEQDATQGQFLSGILQVWVQSFPSPRPVAIQRLKDPVFPTTYP